MKRIEKILYQGIIKAFEEIYNQTIPEGLFMIQKTNKEFDGDLTVVVFPLLKFSKKPPHITADELGKYLQTNLPEIKNYNVIKGFLNLVIDNFYWIDFFKEQHSNITFGISKEKSAAPIVIEYSSPNTNKPLHLGHIRNNLLGYSVARILKANGKNCVKVNLVNDRGIHICKSMIAYNRYGKNETPESSGLKGDHLVGKYYVLFDKIYNEEVSLLVKKGVSKENAEKDSPILKEAQELLKKWENRDKEVRSLWSQMNSWVYDGFDITYKNLGIDFDKTYYESETYLLGKDIVNKGLAEDHLFKKDDGSIWANLTNEGLDEKLLLRTDGTSVYMTQDLGTAQLRYDNYKPSKLIYVVGNEQNYHFEILELILKKLGKEWAKDIHHLSYGMVELPEGKMKSREGKVVDADDLIDEMISTAKATTEELGKIQNFEVKEANKLYRTIALGAIKYFILKVDPKKNMLFNPHESIDFNGNTGPFIQYTYARIKSVLRKSNIDFSNTLNINNISLHHKEKELLKLLYDYPSRIEEAGELYSPAIIANYVYGLAKEFNQYYQEVPILKVEEAYIIEFRVCLSSFVADVIASAMSLLGIDVPDKM